MLCLCYKTRLIATIILNTKLLTNPSRPICLPHHVSGAGLHVKQH